MDIKAETKAALPALAPFMWLGQRRTILESCRGEEGAFFQDMVIALAKTWHDMPVTYQQEPKGDEALAYLHYFRGSADAWITEKDKEDGVSQAFGMVDLGYGPELGYVSITEWIEAGMELDLYWEPKTIRAIREARG